ncbi:MAG TPA: phosphatase PAP2 family protein [Candidatus Baltobacteraceae bacterium]
MVFDIAGALIAFALFTLLGRSLGTALLLSIDTRRAMLRGRPLQVAVFFTNLGYRNALSAQLAVFVLFVTVLHGRILAAGIVVAMHALSQGSLALLKRAYHRDRPEVWLVRHDIGYSYPSGHSATAVTFYLGALLTVAPMPLGITGKLIDAVLAGCVIGVPWSRVALGAHYVSDVTGGLLYGFGWLSLGGALIAALGA